MKGDFSRLTFRRHKRFSGVRMQQGRVQLDADWNEQVDITEHMLSTEVVDLVGHSGGPQDGAAFTIAPDEATAQAAGLPTPTPGDFTIGPGRYYVAGLLLENDAPVSYQKQPDYPGATAPALEKDKVYLAYLDVWQRHITALEDPEIGEPALGGADTATRTRNIWQVKLHEVEGAKRGESAEELRQRLRERYLRAKAFDWEPLSTGALRARVASGATLENQLYRVEIHDGGPREQATFKWSRDNGAVAARVTALSPLDKEKISTLTLASIGRDPLIGFAADEWVELSDEARTLRGEPGFFGRIEAVTRDGLRVDWSAKKGSDNDHEAAGIAYLKELAGSANIAERRLVVRRWDSAGVSGLNKGEASVSLEDNIQVEFDAGTYRSGDYWLIPARNLTGDIDWPTDTERKALAVAPHGVQHHYCSLALLRVNAQSQLVRVDDLRTIFKSLASDLVSKGGDTIEGAVTINTGKGEAALTVNGPTVLNAGSDETTLTVNGPAVLNAGLTLRPTLVATGKVSLREGTNVHAPVLRSSDDVEFNEQFTKQLDQAMLLVRVIGVEAEKRSSRGVPPVGWVEGYVTESTSVYRTIIFLSPEGNVSLKVRFEIYAIFLSLGSSVD